MSEQPARELIGGRYQILATLGKGGMGLVFRAHDPVLERDVAIKKMATSIVDSDEHRRRFQIEARAAARLNHPNIVTIFELEEYRGDFYIVMELLEGLSLASFMQRRPPLPLEAQLTVFAQVCDALDFAHARDIVHRDIKPANLVLLPSGVVKILDFGIAQLASSDLTRKGVLLGTPNYMSPEQINGQSVDARADLFSAGAVAYEMAAGVKAFSADSMAMLLMKISEASYAPLSDVAPQTPPALVTLIARLLSKNRELRPARGCDVREALEEIGSIDRLDLVADAVAGALAPSEGDTLVLRSPADRPTTPVASRVSPHRGGGAARADAQTPGSSAPPPAAAPPSPSPLPVSTSGGGDAHRTLNLGPSDPNAIPPPQAAAEAPPASVSFVAAPSLLPGGTEFESNIAPPPLPPGLAPASSPAASSPPPTLNPPASTPSAATPPASTSSAAPSPPAASPSAASPLAPLPADDLQIATLEATQVAPLGLMSPQAALPDSPRPAVPPPDVPRAATALPADVPPIAPPPVAPPATAQPVAAQAPASLPSPSATAPAAVQPASVQPVAAQPGRAVPGAVPAARRAGKGTAILVIGLLAAMLAIFVGASWLWWQRLRGSIKIPTYTASQQTPTNAAPPTSASNTATPPPTADSTPADAKPEEVKSAEVKPGEPAPADGKATEPASPPPETAPSLRGETPAVDATPAPPPVDTPATQNPATSTPANGRTTNTPPASPVTPPPADARPADTRPTDARPAETRPADKPPAPRDREPSSNIRPSREPAPAVDSTPPPPPPKPSSSKPAAAEPDAAPVPDTPAPEPPRPGSSQRPRTAVDSETVSAFQKSGDATALLGGNQTMNAAAVIRIKDTLERYGKAIEQHDTDTLHSLRDALTPAEQKLLDASSVTVRFADIDVSVEATQATARARRTVTIAGRPAVTEIVDLRLTRRPSGWVITSLSR